MKLYHATYFYQQGETHFFEPRIPESIAGGEDEETKRICFSDSILNCLRGIDGYPKDAEHGQIIRVYEMDISEEDEYLVTWEYLYQTDKVQDAALTHEFWYLKPVSLTSKLYMVSNVKTSEYTVVKAKEKERLIDIAKRIGVYSRSIESYNACGIINDWVKKECTNPVEVSSLMKELLYHERTTIEHDDIYLAIFEEPKRSVFNKEYDHYPLKLVDDFTLELLEG